MSVPAGPAAGADVGATLAKLAVRLRDGPVEYQLVPTHAIERAARRVESSGAARVGLTGGGAARLARLLKSDTARVREFDAWAAGSREQLREAGVDPAEPYLLVSLGTGTSAMLVDGDRVTRVGGTALGGGTLAGLGAALTQKTSFEELTALASRGDRRRVDLLVADIYPEGELPLPGELNAASFAKLRPRGSARHEPADLAHAVMGLVGENVGLICAGLANHLGVDRIVFGGSTLRGNAPLCEILGSVCAALGRTPRFLTEGQFAGALGALELGDGPSR